MSVKNQFSKHANDYSSYNIIQQIVSKALVREINGEPKRILELGCGSGQVYKNLDRNIEYYKAIDFSEAMCKLHPKDENLDLYCFDFDSDEFYNNIKDDKYDLILSSSAMQWSNDLDKLIKQLSKITSEINAVLFTSNTFKTIQNITSNPSPILSIESIRNAFNNHLNCTFEVFNYNLEFDNKKELFKYIKNSGVSGNSKLEFKDAKKLYKEYNLNYLEFEVIFIKGKV